MRLLTLSTKYGTFLELDFRPRFHLSILANGRYWSVWWKDGKFHTNSFDNVWRKNGTPRP